MGEEEWEGVSFHRHSAEHPARAPVCKLLLETLLLQKCKYRMRTGLGDRLEMVLVVLKTRPLETNPFSIQHPAFRPPTQVTRSEHVQQFYKSKYY
jgi:hypothetical protein